MTSMLPLTLAKILVCAFFGICFLQSGLDKVTDWKGNLSWLTGHFEKSPFAKTVPLLLGTMTVFELAAGLASAAATVAFLVKGPDIVGTIAMSLCTLSLLMLFAGQRIAKDYAGAVTLATYFTISVGGLVLMGVEKLP